LGPSEEQEENDRQEGEQEGLTMTTRKTIIVIVDELGYYIPSAAVTSLRRAFQGKRVVAQGMSLAGARAHMRTCLVWRHYDAGRVSFQHEHPELVYPTTQMVNRVADVLSGRLVKKWTAEGYLERCGRGRYRRVQQRRRVGR
jgi:hypothetical protein